MRSLIILALAAALPTQGAAQSTAAAIDTDPPADAVHPAAMTVLQIPGHGVLINGWLYSQPGEEQASDHAWSDHRIYPEAALIRWLARLK